MIEPGMTITAQWNYDDEGFKKLSTDIDAVTESTGKSAESIDRSHLKMARSVARTGMVFGHLTTIMASAASGQMDIVRSLPMLISYFVTLASTIYTVVGAEKARAIAHAIAHAVGSVGTLVPIILAAAAAAAIGIAAISTRQAGGEIYRTGQYKLERGEHVLTPAQRLAAAMTARGVERGGLISGGGKSTTQVFINVSGNTIAEDTLPKLSRKITDDLRASGALLP